MINDEEKFNLSIRGNAKGGYDIIFGAGSGMRLYREKGKKMFCLFVTHHGFSLPIEGDGDLYNIIEEIRRNHPDLIIDSVGGNNLPIIYNSRDEDYKLMQFEVHQGLLELDNYDRENKPYIITSSYIKERIILPFEFEIFDICEEQFREIFNNDTNPELYDRLLAVENEASILLNKPAREALGYLDVGHRYPFKIKKLEDD